MPGAVAGAEEWAMRLSLPGALRARLGRNAAGFGPTDHDVRT